MTTAIQFLRSDQDDLRPNPTTLADGMPMINTNQDSPGLFFKLGDNSLTKIGPTHVGTQQPNVTPRGYPGNCLGEMWLDTSIGTSPTFKVYNGVSWVEAGLPPGGANTNVQYNKNDKFGGDAQFTFDDTTALLNVAGSITSPLLQTQTLNVGAVETPDNSSILSDGTIKLGRVTVSNELVTTPQLLKWPNYPGTLALLSDITGTGVRFYGNVLVSDPAPLGPQAGDMYINSATAVAAATWIGIATQTVVTGQFVFFTSDDVWELGGINDVSTYMTLDTPQTVTSNKIFTGNVTNTGLFSSSGTTTITGDLSVTNASTTISSTLTTVTGDFDVVGSTGLTGTLNVSGATNIVAGLTAGSLATAGNLTVTGDGSMANLTVTSTGAIPTVTSTDVNTTNLTATGAADVRNLIVNNEASLLDLNVTTNIDTSTLVVANGATVGSLTSNGNILAANIDSNGRIDAIGDIGAGGTIDSAPTTDSSPGNTCATKDYIIQKITTAADNTVNLVAAGFGLETNPPGGITTSGTIKISDTGVVQGKYPYATVTVNNAGQVIEIEEGTQFVKFQGTTDVTGSPPAGAAPGDFYLNTVQGNATSSWIGIATELVLANQFVFYTNNTAAPWALGGVSDVSGYVTLGTTQEISGDKTFTGAVIVNNASTSISSTAITMSGPLSISGVTDISAATTITDLLTVDSFTCNGAAALGSLTVSGNTSLQAVQQVGTADLDIVNANTLNVSGTTTFADLTVNNTTNLNVLNVSGLATAVDLNVTNAINTASLAVLGLTSLATASSSGLVELESLTVTNATNVSTITSTGLATVQSLNSGPSDLSSLSVAGTTTLVGNTTAGVVTTTGLLTAASLNVLGNTTFTTISTSGLATLDSLTVTNGSSLNTLSTSGLATLDSLAVTNNETVGGTLGVTGSTTLTTLATSSLATLDSLAVTSAATIGGNLGVTGTTTTADIVATGTVAVTGTIAAVGNITATTTIAATQEITSVSTTSTSNNNVVTTKDFVDAEIADVRATVVTDVTAGTGLVSTPSGGIVTAGSLAIADTAVTPGTYANCSITVNAQGQITAANSNTTVTFKGSCDVTVNPPPSAVAGDFFLNTVQGAAASQWTGIATQTVLVNQFVFYDASGQWDLGGISDVSNYVTLDTTQTIDGAKSFSAQVIVPTTPTNSNNAASKSYADTKLSLGGGTMTGNITFAAGQPTGTSTVPGILSLIDNVDSSDTSVAGSAKAVKTAYDRGSTGVTDAAAAKAVADAALPLAGGIMTGNITFAAGQPLGNGSTPGILTISDSVSSSSTSVAASSAAAKSAYDRGSTGITNAATAQAKADAALPLAGGIMTGNITFAAGQPIATGSTAGIVTISGAIDSTSTSVAATSAAVKAAYDQGTTGINNASTAQSAADTAQSTANDAKTTADNAVSRTTTSAQTMSGNLNIGSKITTNASTGDIVCNSITASETPATAPDNTLVTKSFVDINATEGGSKSTVANDYAVVTSAGSTVTLPSSPVNGQKVMVAVYGTFTNTTIARNGSNIMGFAEDLTLDLAYASITFTFVGGSQGWNIG